MDVTLSQKKFILKITEDPEADIPINFYDIMSQIYQALNQYKQNFKTDQGAGDEGKTSIADKEGLMEAIEFKVKKELQNVSYKKYHEIAQNTLQIQNHYASIGFQSN